MIAPSSHGAAPRPAALESLVCFTLAGRAYALDVDVVREVIHVGAVVAVPSAPAAIAGVVSLRGATVALVDTPQLLALPAPGEARRLALVIARQHGTMCAITIDRVIGVVRFVHANFIAGERPREPPEIAGFLPDERAGLVTVLSPRVLLEAIDRLRFR